MEGPTVTAPTAPGPPVVAPSEPARPLLRGWQRLRSSPFALAVLACSALAALSAAVLPTVPSYDPWSWIVWGREVFDPHLSFAIGGGPSWKPLPFLFTTVFGLFGGAAPTLWVITARAGGLLGLVAAYRLASLLVARTPGPRWEPVLAGAIAAVGVALTQDWAYYMFRGTSEPMLVAAALWAVDRHLAGRRGEAFALGVAASLIRPEAWPFVLVYGALLWRREPRLRALVAAGLLSIPLLWFVPPWIGSGQPFLAASHAQAYNGHLGNHPFLEVLRRGVDLQVAPMFVFGLVAVALAWWRDRDTLILGLAAGAVGWWVLVVAMTLDGYPGLERFYLPAAGLTCVLAGVGVVGVARLTGEFVAGAGRRGAGRPGAGRRGAGRRGAGRPGAGQPGAGRPSAAGLATVGIAAAVVAISIPFTTSRISSARAQKPIADQAVVRLDQLSAAVAAVGAHNGVFPCRSSFAAINHSVQTALAWKLHVTLGRVGTSMRHQGVLFVGPRDWIDGGAAAVSPRLDRRQLLAQVGVWRVYRVWRTGHLTHCVGR